MKLRIVFIMVTKCFQMAARGGAVFGGIAEGLGFDSRLCYWNFSLT